MFTPTEPDTGLSANDASQSPSLGDDVVDGCDWCGRAVRRETAFERSQGGADRDEVVLVCPECELGAD